MFQVPSSITQNLLRFSDRTDRLYIGNIDYRLNSIFTDTPINNTDGLMYWLDSSHNGQLLHYQTNLKKLVLLFRTRVQDLPIESTGSGFRIYAYSSGTLNIFKNMYHLQIIIFISPYEPSDLLVGHMQTVDTQSG